MRNHEVLNKLKKGLTDKIWNDLTSDDRNKQYQGVLQSFRLPGTTTKFGGKIRAFHSSTATLYSIVELNDYVVESKRLTKDELKQKFRLRLIKWDVSQFIYANKFEFMMSLEEPRESKLISSFC